MQTAVINLTDSNIDETAHRAGAVLRSGGIVAFPTDTVYGLGAVCTDAQAVRKVFEAKGRPENKPLSLLVSSISQVEQFAADIPESAYRLMEAFWPGALTVILKRDPEVYIPTEVTAGGSTLGFRMPDNDMALKIIDILDTPVAAPSANLSGSRSAQNGQDVIDDLNTRVDMIIDAGQCQVGISSTIIDLSGDEPQILRQGTISMKEIEKVI